MDFWENIPSRKEQEAVLGRTRRAVSSRPELEDALPEWAVELLSPTAFWPESYMPVPPDFGDRPKPPRSRSQPLPPAPRYQPLPPVPRYQPLSPSPVRFLNPASTSRGVPPSEPSRRGPPSALTSRGKPLQTMHGSSAEAEVPLQLKLDVEPQPQRSIECYRLLALSRHLGEVTRLSRNTLNNGADETPGILFLLLFVLPVDHSKMAARISRIPAANAASMLCLCYKQARREKASKPSSCLGPRAGPGPQDNDWF
ncbi:unnamed protein product [Boreogadus saida]